MVFIHQADQQTAAWICPEGQSLTPELAQGSVFEYWGISCIAPSQICVHIMFESDFLGFMLWNEDY